MHHSEATGDSPGTRKMAHASVFTSRTGSNMGSGGTSASLNAVNMSCNSILNDDHQSSLLIHHTPSTGSSSPSPHHHASTNLNIYTQSQSHQSTGAQVKKKSGFQITSVLPAQISASTNNSIADDTESYDDLDESHTEDLSSSDILDVSVSRATDHGIPERSSSEETLNSLHGGETPGVVSPNEAVNPHLQSIQPGYMVNGTVHHHNHHASGHYKDQGMSSMATPQQPFQGIPVCSALVHSSAQSADTTVQSVAVVQSRTQRSASVQAAAVDVSASGKVNQALFSASGSASGASGSETSGGMTGSNAVGGSLVGATVPPGNSTIGIAVTAVQPPPASSTTQIQASTAIASRFRVVKLDSSSESFRKGRWMCMEYYEKEALAAAPFTDAALTCRLLESFIHSESESTSGGTGDQGMQPTQQTFIQPAVPVVHSSLSQTTSQLHTPSQDAGMHTLGSPPVAPPNNTQVVSVPSLLGTEGQPPPLRAQQQIPYIVEGHTGQLQSGYPVNQQPSMLMNQGLQSVDYAQISQGIQAPAQSHPMLPVQSSSAPTPVPSLPVGTPTLSVPQPVSPRPQVPVPQMVLAQGSTINQVQQHQPQMPPEQQQQATANQPPQPMSSTTSQTPPSIPSSLSNIQPGIPPSLPHGGPVGGHSGGLSLTLHHQGGQSSQPPLTRGPYSGVTPLTASQLEDAGRLLLQHQSLLSLPRLATGVVSGLTGQYGSEASASFGQEGSASGDAGALATSAGTDEDSNRALFKEAEGEQRGQLIPGLEYSTRACVCVCVFFSQE
ncbi:TSC22 domain family protein 1-like isoform X2 [Neoarius graeffei]|uniref:TSC22 domain family protein 1-like isoform X2 n=1 Tax=Neoarius graeffei TaxID=443677 RepID=UPI00298BD8C7|nr:TSC22 domain family protein 1-like isoform X2 [Neoarius graeffei]